MDSGASETSAQFTLQLTIGTALLTKKTALTLGSPRYYVVVLVDGAQVQKTNIVKGQELNWDETFSLAVQESSTVKIEITRQVKRPGSHDKLIGEVILKEFQEGVTEESRNIYKPGKRDSSQGSLTLRLAVERTVSGADSMMHPRLEPASSALSEAARISSFHVAGSMDTDPGESGSFAVVLDRVQKIILIGGAVAELSPYAKVAWTVLASIPQALIDQLDRDGQVRTLWQAAAEMLDFLKEAESISGETAVAKTVKQMVQQIYECALFIREYGGKGYLGRTLRDASSSSTSQKITAFTTSFQDLRQQFQSRSVLESWKVVREIHRGVIQLGSVVETINAIEQARLLDNLPGANISQVRWDMGNTCLPNTRLELIDEIVGWANSPEGTSLFWLNGVAGSGKSTVSNSIAKLFDQLERLAGSFRFSRDIAQRNEPTYIFGNLAYQLAHFSPQLKTRLLAAIDRHGPMGSSPLRNQFRTYIVDVLSGVELAGPVVFVIDALDESGSEQTRTTLLDALASEVAHLPKSVRILIISRDEADIRAQLKWISTSKAMHQLEDTPRDILAFVNDKMPQIRARSEKLVGTDWPDTAAREKLVEKSHGLFIWAVIACRYIQDMDPETRLKAVLSSSRPALEGAESSLNHLYLRILRDVCADRDLPFQEVVGSIVVAMTPLTIQGLDDLLACAVAEGVEHDLSHLGSAESVVGLLGSIFQRERGITGAITIRVLHPSLLDFFTNPRRCTDVRFFIQPSIQHRSMFLRCIAVMRCLLKRDICEIDDPTKLNSEVSDLPQRRQKYLPEHLQYSCRFWTSHLDQIDDIDDQLRETTSQFLYIHLLHWIEAMTLLNEFETAFSSLEKIHKRFESNDIISIAADALRFMQRFETPIRESAAHIYVSALAFTPLETTLSRLFHAAHTRGVPKVHTGLPLHWSACLAIYSSPGMITVMSVDRLRFATRSSNSFHIRNITTGAISCSFTIDVEEHDFNPFSRLEFSPDGSYLLIGLNDTVQLWDSFTGKKWFGPVSARSYQLSPDGRYLATVSDALKIWDLAQKTVVAEPDVGAWPQHLTTIFPPLLIFSPNGQWLLRWSQSPDSSDISIAFLKVSTWAVNWVLSDHPAGYLATGTQPSFSWIDGNAVVFGTDTTIKILDAGSGEILHRWEAQSFITSLHASTHQTIVVTSGSLVTLVESSSGEILAGPFDTASGGFDLSEDATRMCLWTASEPAEGTIRIISCETGNDLVLPLTCRFIPRTSTSARWTLDNTHISLLFADGKLLVWNIGNADQSWLQLPMKNPRSFSVILLSPDCTRLLVADFGEVQLFDLSMDLPLRTTQTRSEPNQPMGAPPGIDRRIVAVATSDRNSKIVVYFNDFSMEIMDSKNGHADERLLGHSNTINSVTFSVDGTQVVSASTDMTVRLWNVEKASAMGNPIRGHSGPVMAAAFSNCTGKIVSASLDKTVRIWDAENGHQLWLSKSLIHNMSSVSFCQGDTKLIAISDSEPEGFHIVLDLETSDSWPLLPIGWTAFSPFDDNIVAFSGNGDRWAWEISGSVAGYNSNTLSSYSRLVTVKFSPENSQAVVILNDSALTIHNVETGNVVHIPAPEDVVEVVGIDWLPSGSLVAISCMGSLRVWDTETAKLAAEQYFPPHALRCSSSDGSRIAFCHRDAIKPIISVELYDVSTSNNIWKYQQSFEGQVSAESISFSGNNSEVIVSIGKVHINTSGLANMTRMVLTLHAESGHFMALSVIQTQENTFRARTASWDSLPRVRVGQQDDIHAHSTDLTKLASFTTTRTIAVLDLATGSVVHTLLKSGTQHLYSQTLTYSPDGRLVACAARSGVFIWSSQTGENIHCWPYSLNDLEYNSPDVFRNDFLVFSHDSTQIMYLVGSDPTSPNRGSGIYLWDLQAGVLTGVIYTAGYILSFFPDGTGFSTSTGHIDSAMEYWAISRDAGSRGIKKIELGYPEASASQHYPFLLSPDGNITIERGCDAIYTGTRKPVDIINQAQAFLGDRFTSLSNFIFSADSTRLCILKHGSLMGIYNLGSATDAIQEITASYTCPSEIQITGHGIIDPDGWLYGHTGQRLLWIPQTDRKIWAFLGSGRLILENNEGQLVVVDLQEYMKFPQVARGWRDRSFLVKHRPDGLAMAVHRVNIIQEFKGRKTHDVLS